MLKAESAYLAGVEGNLEAAKGVHLQGSRWRTVRFDQSDRLRALMAQHRNYDRNRLKELPQNRTVAVHGYRRRWLFGKKPTGVAMASVICPLEKLADPAGEPGESIDLPELMAHVRELVTDTSVPHLIGVCAPSGFTPEALRAKPDLPNVTLVLVQPQDGGGWNVTSPEGNLPPTVVALFDPEKDHDKIERVREEIENRRVELLTGSMSAASLAERLSLPAPLVADAMERVAREHPELRVTRESNNVLLYRGAAAATKGRTSMSVVDRIRQLFAREGDEAEKINILTERRAKLAARKDRLYEEIAKLEAKEAELLEQGRATKSEVVRRRLASQLSQLRKDIGRQNTIANMLNKQTDILSTDIHNLTLIEQGKVAELPSTEDLTENAVQAEEMLETLAADAELVSGLETGTAEAAMTENELAILKEFEEAEEAPPEQPEATTHAPEKEPAGEEPDTTKPPESTPPESTPPKRQADAEAS
jgi:hypothetical protein